MFCGHLIKFETRQVNMNKVVVSLNLAMIDLIVGDLLLFDKGRRKKVQIFWGGEKGKKKERGEEEFAIVGGVSQG